MKVYQFNLKTNYTFCVYEKDDKLILINDEANPYPCTTSIYDKSTDTYGKNTFIHKIVFPTFAVIKEDYEEFMRTKYSASIAKYLIDYLFLKENYNVALLTKDWGDKIEVGCVETKCSGELENVKFQRQIERHIKLQAFK